MRGGECERECGCDCEPSVGKMRKAIRTIGGLTDWRLKVGCVEGEFVRRSRNGVQVPRREPSNYPFETNPETMIGWPTADDRRPMTDDSRWLMVDDWDGKDNWIRQLGINGKRKKEKEKRKDGQSRYQTWDVRWLDQLDTVMTPKFHGG